MRRFIIGLVLFGLWLGLAGCSQTEYNTAIELFDSGQYEEASIIFASLDNYKNSKEFLVICNYNIAFSEYENGNYRAALSRFEEIKDYKDSAQLSMACEYALAMEAFENKDFDGAAAIFNRLGNFENSEYMYKACKYRQLIAYIVENGSYLSTSSIYYIDEQECANGYRFLITDGETVSYRYSAIWEDYSDYFHFYYDCLYTLDRDPYYSLDTMSYTQVGGNIIDGSYVEMEGYLDINTGKILSVQSKDICNVDINDAKEMVEETQEDGLDFIKDIIKKSGIGLTLEEMFG